MDPARLGSPPGAPAHPIPSVRPDCPCSAPSPAPLGAPQCWMGQDWGVAAQPPGRDLGWCPGLGVFSPHFLPGAGGPQVCAIWVGEDSPSAVSVPGPARLAGPGLVSRSQGLCRLLCCMAGPTRLCSGGRGGSCAGPAGAARALVSDSAGRGLALCWKGPGKPGPALCPGRPVTPPSSYTLPGHRCQETGPHLGART